MRFEVIFKEGMSEIATVRGIKDIPSEEIGTVEFVALLSAEQFIEKLTGLRVHINEVRGE